MIRKALLSGLTLLAIAMPSKAKATLIHDIEATPNYSNEYGIRLKDSQGNLLEGSLPSFDKYSGDLNVKFKLKNIGESPEDVVPQGFILDENNSSIYFWNHSSTTLIKGQYKYRERNLNLSMLENGVYTIRVGAELDGDENLSNNYTSRNFQVIPEPSTLALLGLGAIFLAKGKRK